MLDYLSKRCTHFAQIKVSILLNISSKRGSSPRGDIVFFLTCLAQPGQGGKRSDSTERGITFAVASWSASDILK